MTSVTRLLTVLLQSVRKTFNRSIHIVLLHREIKVYHMTTIPLKHLLIKNLRKQASSPEALFSTYLNFLEFQTSRKTPRVFRRTIMEPFLNACYKTVDPQTCTATEVVTATHTVPNQPSVSNTDPNSNLPENSIPKNDILRDQKKYKSMRKWKRKKHGRGIESVNPEENIIIRLFSFNILAQNLLEGHPYLYKQHDPRALNWKVRKELLIQEILGAKANVICLQEMQEEHLNEFVKPFEDHGYKYLYKRRTNDKLDGLLLMYRTDTFNLDEFTNVEFFQSGVELLNRDNVAIIAKLSLKDSPETKVVVATTHLLYNPRRNDIRLGQVQILMAELERIAFIKNTMKGQKYLPIIIAGDFNLQPMSGVYEFITKSKFEFVGRSRTLERQRDHRPLSNSLIPPNLHVTDGCQHYHILVKRFCDRGEGRSMLGNSETSPSDNDCQTLHRNKYKKTEVNTKTQELQEIRIADDYYVSFGSGRLHHQFNLRSVYSHTDRDGQNEATTYQDEWVTVDYIFHSDIKLIEKYALPTRRQCKDLAFIPNLATGSDHLSLGAAFLLRKKTGP